jgi:hypothetical protein
LKDHLDRLTQEFKIAEDYAETEEEFEITFEYMQYLMRKYISDKIGQRHEEIRKNRNARTGPSQNKNAQLLEEMQAITKKERFNL